MVKTVSVRFRTAGKAYSFSTGDLEIKKGDFCIVETARGQEYGKVVSDPVDRDETAFNTPLRPVLRIATAEDGEKNKANREKEKEAIKICKEKIYKHELEMKLIDAEYTFDNSKLLFYFTADGRVDFRELVKDLAGVFRTRIELRQIGVRDETKLLGGYGPCGRELCCHSYLSDFVPVSIKMAKEQNLSLNPAKISGVCGRLMCCLKNEEETYEYLNRLLPGVGDLVADPTGAEGTVTEVNVLRQRLKVLFETEDEKEIKEYPASEITFKAKKKKGQKQQKKKASEEEILEEKEIALLEAVEREEGPSALNDIESGEETRQKPDRKKKNFRRDKDDTGERSDKAKRGKKNRGKNRRNPEAGGETGRPSEGQSSDNTGS